MNPQYGILRFAKYKGPEISKIEAHNERTKDHYDSNKDIDMSRTHLNFHLKSRHSIKERMDELAELEEMRRIVNAIPQEIREAHTQRKACQRDRALE